ncbi:MAG: ABC transporter ATP-binding protein [Actinomycetales bacterium]|nr:ABC transporter ATP-binding protein [Actinomycetales bacterium]
MSEFDDMEDDVELEDGGSGSSSRWGVNKEKLEDIAISVQDLSITYRTSFESAPTLKSTLQRLGRRNKLVKTVDAIKGISFDIQHGTVLGVVGHNGAGKSTLLRAIAGIMPPSSGQIVVNGEVSALLSLAAGFNSALSAPENVLLAGLAAGMSRDEVLERVDEIIAFAEIEDFRDMPVKTYSSGMAARLAFSAAVHMKPDILLIDEALSAGDARFKVKAQNKMRELMASARTMVVVSHGANTIRDLCSDAIWLDHGNLMMHGEVNNVVDEYLSFMKVGKKASAATDDF